MRPPWGASRPWLLIRLRLFETLGASSRSCPQQRRLELIAYDAGQKKTINRERETTERLRLELVAFQAFPKDDAVVQAFPDGTARFATELKHAHALN